MSYYRQGYQRLLSVVRGRTVEGGGEAAEWSSSLDPTAPDNFWIDDATGERVNAATGERAPRL